MHDLSYYFDNVLVTNDAEKAKEYREKHATMIYKGKQANIQPGAIVGLNQL